MHYQPFIFSFDIGYVYSLYLIVCEIVHIAQWLFLKLRKTKEPARLFYNKIIHYFAYLFLGFRELLSLHPSRVLHYGSIVDLDHLPSPLTRLSPHFIGEMPVKAGY